MAKSSLTVALLLFWETPGWSQTSVTVEQAIENYRETFQPLKALDCPSAADPDEIVVCGRRVGEADPHRLPLSVTPEPGAPVRIAGEPPTGGDALAAEQCIRLCPSQVGVNLEMVIKFAEGIGRLLEGDD